MWVQCGGLSVKRDIMMITPARRTTLLYFGKADNFAIFVTDEILMITNKGCNIVITMSKGIIL